MGSDEIREARGHEGDGGVTRRMLDVGCWIGIPSGQHRYVLPTLYTTRQLSEPSPRPVRGMRLGREGREGLGLVGWEGRRVALLSVSHPPPSFPVVFGFTIFLYSEFCRWECWVVSYRARVSWRGGGEVGGKAQCRSLGLPIWEMYENGRRWSA